MRMKIVTGLIAAAILCGCGQTGPLYLPDAGVTTPVEVRSPGTLEEEKEEKEKDRVGDPPQTR